MYMCIYVISCVCMRACGIVCKYVCVSVCLCVSPYTLQRRGLAPVSVCCVCVCEYACDRVCVCVCVAGCHGAATLLHCPDWTGWHCVSLMEPSASILLNTSKDEKSMKNDGWREREIIWSGNQGEWTFNATFGLHWKTIPLDVLAITRMSIFRGWC